jgi:hypothetical protein
VWLQEQVPNVSTINSAYSDENRILLNE